VNVLVTGAGYIGQEAQSEVAVSSYRQNEVQETRAVLPLGGALCERGTHVRERRPILASRVPTLWFWRVCWRAARRHLLSLGSRNSIRNW
jgi:hypothetical protein